MVNYELEEALVDRLLKLEDIGWKRLDQWADDSETGGLTLEALKELSQQLREITASHPLFKRGVQLRNAYIFGRGMNYVGVDAPRHKRIIDNIHNESMLFSVEAYEVMNSALFNDGVFSVMRNRETNKFTVLPLHQITGLITNPDDNMDIWYVQRSWSANGKERVAWYPTARRRNEKIETSLKVGEGRTIHINHTNVVYMKHANRQAGWTLGVPDSFPALLWTLAYSGYLSDSAKLVTALSKFAWNLTAPSKNAAEKARTRVVNAKDGIGGVAIGSGDVSSVGVPSAQVNFNNGQPLAAMVAASFGVPVIALLSSPGATGGSYGAAQTLDAPTLKGFEVLQNSWGTFFREIFLDLGAKDGRVEFPAMDVDPPHRQVTSIAQGVELGLLHRDEARDMLIDILDVRVLHDELPELPAEGEGDGEDEGKPKPKTVVSKQGVSTKLGGTSNAGITDHSLDKDNEKK